MAPATVSVPLASRPYYRTHRRNIETAIAAAVKTVMETVQRIQTTGKQAEEHLNKTEELAQQLESAVGAIQTLDFVNDTEPEDATMKIAGAQEKLKHLVPSILRIRTSRPHRP